MSRPLADVPMEYRHLTDKALKARDADGNDHWFPLSQIEYVCTSHKGDTIDPGDTLLVTMPQKMAEEKGLV